MDNLTQRRVPKRKLHIHFPYFFAVLMFLGFIALMVSLKVPDEFKELVLIIPALLFVLVPERIQLFIWHRAWRKIAEEIKFEYIEDETSKKLFSSSLPTLEGQYQGRYVYIRGYKVRHGKSKRIRTEITIGLKEETQGGIEITAKSWANWHNLSRANAFFQEYKTNDKEFDKGLRVKSTDEIFAKKILSAASLKQGLREITSTQMRISASRSTLIFTEQGYMMDGAYMLGVLDVLDELSDEIAHYNRYAPKKEEVPNEKRRDTNSGLNMGKAQGKSTRGERAGKKSSKLFLWLLSFLLTCIALVFLVVSIDNGTIGNVGVFLGIILVLYIASSWDSIPGTKHYKSHRAVKELKTLLRKELLPLGFQEERDSRASAQGFIRGDIRANIFEHKNNQTLNFIIQKTSETPSLTLVSVEKPFRKEKDFKVQVIEALKGWLAENPSDGSSNHILNDWIK